MSRDSNFKNDILEATAGDTIIAVKILSPLSEWAYGEPDKRDTPELLAAVGKIISFAEALNLLNYSYDAGFGSMDCHDILMWSEQFVYYIHEYDGSTSIYNLERNPTQ